MAEINPSKFNQVPQESTDAQQRQTPSEKMDKMSAWHHAESNLKVLEMLKAAMEEIQGESSQKQEPKASRSWSAETAPFRESASNPNATNNDHIKTAERALNWAHGKINELKQEGPKGSVEEVVQKMIALDQHVDQLHDGIDQLKQGDAPEFLTYLQSWGGKS